MTRPVTATYPEAFYVAHRLFHGPSFPKPTWGDVLDGPVSDFSEVVTICFDAFDDIATRKNLRVWHVTGNGAAIDVTDDVIGSIDDRYGALNA